MLFEDLLPTDDVIRSCVHQHVLPVVRNYRDGKIQTHTHTQNMVSHKLIVLATCSFKN
jgi:hypothetical protein